jgi:hypothetical protein
MSESKYPAGWDAARVQRLIEHYESLSEDELAAEDEDAVTEEQGQTVITVPDELLPAIRQLLATHKTASPVEQS